MKKKKQIVALVSLCSIAAFGGFGCSVTSGGLGIKSQFVYPNSNVTALGPAKAEWSKTGFFMAPNMTINDIRGTYNKALSQVSGANVLVNYKEDTTVTLFPLFPIYTIRYVIEGEAAHMEVGKKVLK